MDIAVGKIETRLVPDFTIRVLSYKLPVIDFNPPYQREGDIWPEARQRKLIDTIINNLDMPKLYFERVQRRVTDPTTGLNVQFAVLDGKQRLEAIQAFMQNEIALPDDFSYFSDSSVEAGGMFLADLQKSYPKLAEGFFSYELPIVEIRTNSGDLIEEMFQRLNDASTLNSAERRNAISGPIRDAANELALHDFFEFRIAIKNARYKHRELSAKFLLIEEQILHYGKVSDTKARTLEDLYVRSHRDELSQDQVETLKRNVKRTLDRMSSVFEENDRLLASISTVVVYYLVFRDLDECGEPTRQRLQDFEDLRRKATREDEEGPGWGALRRYNAFVQSTNDGSALQFRAGIIGYYLRNDVKIANIAELEEVEDNNLIPSDEDA